MNPWTILFLCTEIMNVKVLAIVSTWVLCLSGAFCEKVSLCHTGPFFEAISCSDFSSASELSTRTTSSGGCKNLISCNDGGELYDLRFDFITGTNINNAAQNMYYARGSAQPIKGSTTTGTHCWKRYGAGGDGCACLCENVRYGLYRDRPECSCKFLGAQC